MREFKDVVGFEGLYKVSNDGIIWSVRYDRELKARPDKDGYPRVNLIDRKGKSYTRFVHRLVAIAFIPMVEGKRCVNHIDEVKQNNHMSNLEWVTNKENNLHGTRMSKIAKANSRAVVQMDLEGNVIAVHESMKIAARTISNDETKLLYIQSSISQACNGKSKTARGYRWKLLNDKGAN